MFIVTGASSGIGFATAQALAAQHHRVVVVARSTESLEFLKSQFADYVQVFPADLSDKAERASVVEKIKAFGKLDGIVHAAGSLIVPASYDNLEIEKILADMNVHVAVPIALNNALKKELVGARIVYIDSHSASSLRVGWSGYSVVKAAAQMAARAAVEEIADSTVIRIYPGAVNTPLVNTLLRAEQHSPTQELFKQLDRSGEIVEPAVVGKFIADILVSASDKQLAERECWDFTLAADRVL